MDQRAAEAVIDQAVNNDDTARKLKRLEMLEETMSTLRHDLRGMLAPALLVADRLIGHADPKVVRAGEIVVKSVERAEERLQDTKPGTAA